VCATKLDGMEFFKSGTELRKIPYIYKQKSISKQVNYYLNALKKQIFHKTMVGSVATIGEKISAEQICTD